VTKLIIVRLRPVLIVIFRTDSKVHEFSATLVVIYGSFHHRYVRLNPYSPDFVNLIVAR